MHARSTVGGYRVVAGGPEHRSKGVLLAESPDAVVYKVKTPQKVFRFPPGDWYFINFKPTQVTKLRVMALPDIVKLHYSATNKVAQTKKELKEMTVVKDGVRKPIPELLLENKCWKTNESRPLRNNRKVKKKFLDWSKVVSSFVDGMYITSDVVYNSCLHLATLGDDVKESVYVANPVDVVAMVAHPDDYFKKGPSKFTLMEEKARALYMPITCPLHAIYMQITCTPHACMTQIERYMTKNTPTWPERVEQNVKVFIVLNYPIGSHWVALLLWKEPSSHEYCYVFFDSMKGMRKVYGRRIINALIKLYTCMEYLSIKSQRVRQQLLKNPKTWHAKQYDDVVEQPSDTYRCGFHVIARAFQVCTRDALNTLS